MATVTKDFRVKAGLVVEGSTATVNGHDILTEALVDAKGDILVASAADTVTRLAVGTNNYVLTADDQATNGIAWKAPAAVGEFTSSITFEGTTANDFETTVAVTDPTADRTITFPDATGTVALTSDITVTASSTNTFSNKSISLATNTVTGTTAEFNAALSDSNFVTTGDTGTVTSTMITDGTIVDGDINASAAIAQSKIQGLTTDLAGKASSSDLTNHTSATEAHGATGAVVGTTNTQTLTNKTLTSPKINEDVAVTATATELNVLDGITSSTAELNLLDGVTATTTEINYIDGVTSAIQTQLNDKLALAGGTMTGAIAMGTSKITGLGTPTDAADAATKAYVDSAAQGIDWKASVRAATVGDNTLASKYQNGDVIDGVTLATGDRILIKNQATASENGIYVVNASGAPTRSTDADTSAELTSNFAVFVEEGTVNADQGYVLTNNGAITIGTTELVFTQFTGLGQIIAGTGLDKTGNTLDIDSTVVTLTGTQTLTNKTLTSAKINTLTFEGMGANTLLDFQNPSTNRTVYFPNASGTLAVVENKLDVFAATTSSELRTVISDETGTGALVFADTPTLINASTNTLDVTGHITLPDARIGSATATVGTSATTVDFFETAQYSAAKYVVQLKKSGNIEVIEILVAVDGSNNVYLTEYANVQSNGELGTTNAVYESVPLIGGTVKLQVTAAAADTSVKVSKTYIEA